VRRHAVEVTVTTGLSRLVLEKVLNARRPLVGKQTPKPELVLNLMRHCESLINFSNFN
jgi:hypothetical protein